MPTSKSKPIADPNAPPLTFAEKIAKSSQVDSVTYDPDKQILSVIFKRTPAIYDYQQFPPAKWAELQAAESIGSYLYRNVTRPNAEGRVPYTFIKTSIARPGAEANA